MSKSAGLGCAVPLHRGGKRLSNLVGCFGDQYQEGAACV